MYKRITFYSLLLSFIFLLSCTENSSNKNKPTALNQTVSSVATTTTAIKKLAQEKASPKIVALNQIANLTTTEVVQLRIPRTEKPEFKAVGVKTADLLAVRFKTDENQNKIAALAAKLEPTKHNFVVANMGNLKEVHFATMKPAKLTPIKPKPVTLKEIRLYPLDETTKITQTKEQLNVANIKITKVKAALAKKGPTYRVFGRSYQILTSSKNYEEKGLASWYGRQFHRRFTSSGERYNMFKMTAAHKTLPLPTYVMVTNLRNGRKVVVKVNDRGPFVSNRIIDLSYAAAQKLGMVGRGIVRVSVKAVSPGTLG